MVCNQGLAGGRCCYPRGISGERIGNNCQNCCSRECTAGSRVCAG